MAKPSVGFKAGQHPEFCVFCGGKLPRHKKACPLPGDLQKVLGKKVFCPLCGKVVSGDHVCSS